MSSSSNITVENIISIFPKSPTKIDGQPTYQTLKDLKDTLIENAASIDSARGSGNHGLLGLVVTLQKRKLVLEQRFSAIKFSGKCNVTRAIFIGNFHKK
jgi:hypothetical protein